jgi:hypothetical protein
VTSLSSAERLELLQKHDPLRTWTSPNDVRACICCGRKLTGLRLRIWLDEDRYSFGCPTQGCAGTLADFVMPGDPFSDDTVWADWIRTIDQVHPAAAAT